MAHPQDPLIQILREYLLEKLGSTDFKTMDGPADAVLELLGLDSQTTLGASNCDLG